MHRMTISDFKLNDRGPKEFDKSSKQSVKLEKSLSTSAGGTDSYMSLDTEPEPEILLQSVTHAISHDQLTVEIKSIYAGLIILESKYIAVNECTSWKLKTKFLFIKRNRVMKNGKLWSFCIKR